MTVNLIFIPAALFAGFLLGWFGMYFKLKRALKRDGIDVTITYD